MFKLPYFVLQRKLTEFSAILKQQQNDNMSRLTSRQKRGLEQGQLQTAGNYKKIAPCFQVILAGTLTGAQGDIRMKVLATLSTVKYLLVT